MKKRVKERMEKNKTQRTGKQNSEEENNRKANEDSSSFREM